MDPELMARLRKRPQKWVTVDGIEFLLQLPTREAQRDIFIRAGSDKITETGFASIAGPTARGCVVDWKGVTLGDIGVSEQLNEDERTQSTEFSPGLADLYFADRPDMSTGITSELFEWLAERRKSREADAKNS